MGRLAWKLIRPQLEASIRRYEACVTNGNKGKEFGKLGGRPRKTPTHNPKEKPQTTTPTHNPLNHNDNDNDNLNGNDNGVIGGEVAAKRAAFVAPSLEIVKDYFSTIKGSDADAECFYDHFTANGWKVSGKSSMKDWKAAARNWMRRKSEFSTTIQKQTNHETKRIYKDL